MSELASPGQLRWSFARWALVTVPLLLVLGTLSGRLSNSGYGNPWFDALVKPDLMPPGWAFGVAWTILYALQGLALAMVLNARGAAGRGRAIALFAAQFAVNLLWSPVFFALHQPRIALGIIALMLALAVATTFAFARIRTAAAWLMVPYLVWITFAAGLNYRLIERNPQAESLVVRTPSAQIELN